MNPYLSLLDDRAHELHAEHLAELADGMAVSGATQRRKRQAKLTEIEVARKDMGLEVVDRTPQEAAKALTAHRALRRELQAELAAEARKARR